MDKFLITVNFISIFLLTISDNFYENSWYDALNNKLYEFDRMDIETFDFS